MSRHLGQNFVRLPLLSHAFSFVTELSRFNDQCRHKVILLHIAG